MFRNILRVLKILGIGFRLVWQLMWDPRVPRKLKLLPVAAILYLVWPFDLVPDFIPVLGQLDDLAVIAILLGAFIILSPWQVVLEHALSTTKIPGTRQTPKASRHGPTVEARYRVDSND